MRLISDNSSLSTWDHSYCSIGCGGPASDYLRTSGAEVTVLGTTAKIPSVPAILLLWKYLLSNRPRVLHLHGAEANFHGVIAGRLAGIPIILAEEIGIPNHSPKARRVFAWTYRRCSRLIAISQAVKDQMVALGEATPEMIEVIHNPFEPQTFRPVPCRTDTVKLGFVGRLEAVKNPVAAVEAVSILRRRGLNASLRMVGDGSQRSAIEDQIGVLGLEDHIELCGFYSRPFELLHDCHFYVQPSLAEGFGLAVCEAMSAGIPVIASGVGGVPEIIEHGATGWLLRNPNAQTLADTIEEASALNNSALSQIAEQARASVIKRFGVATYLRRLDGLYHFFAARKDQTACS